MFDLDSSCNNIYFIAGKECQKLVEDLTIEARRPPSPEPAKPPPPPRHTRYMDQRCERPPPPSDDEPPSLLPQTPSDIGYSSSMSDRFPSNQSDGGFSVPDRFPSNQSDGGYSASDRFPSNQSDGSFSAAQSDSVYSMGASDGSFQHTPQTPLTPQTPQIGGYGQDNYWGQPQTPNMYNMNMPPPNMEPNFPQFSMHQQPPQFDEAHLGMAPHHHGMTPHQHNHGMTPHQDHRGLTPHQHNSSFDQYGHGHHRKHKGRDRRDWKQRDRRDSDRERDFDRDCRRDHRDQNWERGRDRERDNGYHKNRQTFQSAPPAKPPSPDGRNLSLESRIEFLLKGQRQSQDSESSRAGFSPEEPPEEQHDSAPPLPPDGAPPPPLPTDDVSSPPPLPPEPPEPEHINNHAPPILIDEHRHTPTKSICDKPTMSLDQRIKAMTEGLDTGDSETGEESGVEAPPVGSSTELPPSAAEGGGSDMEIDDDDKMSLSSISSGEEKLVLTVPHQSQPYPSGQPPPPGFDSFPDLSKPPPILVNNWPPGQTHNFPNFTNNFNTIHNQFNNYNVNFNQQQQQSDTFAIPPHLVMTPQDESRENMFIGVMQKIISELKVILGRDLQKKMVHSTGFKSFDGWWETQENKTKVQHMSCQASY